ncbi:MAG: hypothetical protein KDC84_12725 [Crocinitomicaceae bacterium]|nr:hypothetical protein [Crocinitomicaceae bacterium]
MTETIRPVVIQKEAIANLMFPKTEVLNSRTEIHDRDEELSRALVLGNSEHLKVRILFEDIEGKKQVETTIWGLTAKEVILKQHVVIPINRIVSINIL